MNEDYSVHMECFSHENCVNLCGGHDLCTCHENKCYKGDPDPRCNGIENGKRYQGQAPDTWCHSGRRDSRVMSGDAVCQWKPFKDGLCKEQANF